MHHQILVGVLHRAAYVLKEGHSLRGPQLPVVAPGLEWSAVDELHGEPGSPVGGEPAIQQSGNMWMMEPSENLPFGQEAPVHLCRVHPGAHQLEGYLLLELTVRPVGQVHLTHAAPGQFTQDPKRADAHSCVQAGSLGQELRLADYGGEEFGRRRLEKIAGPGIGGEQAFDFRPESRIAAAGACEIPRSLGGGKIERLVQDPGYVPPAFRGQLGH